MIMVGARTSIAVALVAVGIGMAVGVPLGLLPPPARAAARRDHHARQRSGLRLPERCLIAIMITAVFGARRDQRHHRHRHLQHSGVRPADARRRAVALDPGFRPGGAGGRQGAARISAEHILPNIANLLIVQGTIQFSLGILAEAGLSLCRPRRPAADAKLGPDAGRQPDDDLARARTWRCFPASPSS
jgi:peptide/nickel transport system permease protein